MPSSKSQTEQEKKLSGKVYTPDFIVTKMLDDVGFHGDNPQVKIVDPACGDGQFLKQIVQRILENCRPDNFIEALENVHGWDIDQMAVQKCRRDLNELIKPYHIAVEWNISVNNSITQLLATGFDFIVGNPPYIRIQNLTQDTRSFIRNNYEFCSKGSTDIYIAFFELASRILTRTGTCAYITPNSYFVSETAFLLRSFFEQERNLLRITNYKNELVFEDAATYSAITIFTKQQQVDFLYEERDENFNYIAKRMSFEQLSGRRFWFLTLSNQFLGSKTGTRLGDICKISVGIATLADWAYIVKIVKTYKNNTVEVQNKKGTLFKVEQKILKPIIKASRLKSTDEAISEYIIYPYQKNQQGKSEIIPEGSMKSEYPLTYDYLLKIKDELDKRDKSKPNPVKWYAFGRTQSMDTSIGEKIVFSPMKKKPNFIISKNPEGLVYSGYYIKYNGDYQLLADILNSKEMEDYLDVTGRYFRHGWRGLTKKVLEDFIIQ